MKPYLTVGKPATAEYEEKRSRFIAEVFYCNSEEMAASLLNETRTKYWDAKHHCYAFLLHDGTARFSDDGEPHSTAGKPIFDALCGSGMVDALVIVTRYFGGTLLGTGGLVHAYSTVTTDALRSAQRVEMCPCITYETVYSYADHATFERLLKKYNGITVATDFGETVTIRYRLRENENLDSFLRDLTDQFAGKLSAHEIEHSVFAFSL